MKILVTGANGQIGSEVVKLAKEQGYDVFAATRENMDLQNKSQITHVMATYRPNVVIHCGAWTNVDGAEDNEEMVRDINAGSTLMLSKLCRLTGAVMILLSTDYVFDGEVGDISAECRDYNPLNIYGKTKMFAEKIVENHLYKYFIVRTSWVFGNGKNFVRTMMNLSKTNKEISVVNDQFGHPTYAKDIAKILIEMCESKEYGIYNVTNDGEYVSWCDFAKEIFDIIGADVNVIGVDSSQYPTKAKRPKNNWLNISKLNRKGFTTPPHWKDALKRYINEEKENGRN